MPIVNRVADLHAEITGWRRDLHAHPELQYDVHRTAALGRRQAQELRLRRGRYRHRPHRRRRRHPRPQAGRQGRSGMRADMDALPIEEATTVAVQIDRAGQDARLRPRRPHRHAARRRQISCRDAQFRRHRGGHLPAGGGGRRRRPGDDATTACSTASASRRSSACTIIPACRSANSPFAPGR